MFSLRDRQSRACTSGVRCFSTAKELGPRTRAFYNNSFVGKREPSDDSRSQSALDVISPKRLQHLKR